MYGVVHWLKMRNVHAVAAMTDVMQIHAMRQRAVRGKPRGAVCKHRRPRLILHRPDSQAPIPARVERALPEQTSVQLDRLRCDALR